MRTSVLLESIPEGALGDHIRANGTLRIQRRWIENTLPDWELLDAVAIGYGRIAELVGDAHRALGLPLPSTVHVDTGKTYAVGRGGRLPCMTGHAENRTLNVSLATGGSFQVAQKDFEPDMSRAEEAVKHYGVRPEEIFDRTAGYEGLLQSFFRTARIMTEKDGHHPHMVFLLANEQPVSIRILDAGSQGEKYMMMRTLAHEITKLNSDAVIMISEAWGAKADPSKPYMRAADAADREEWL